jgi:hypothetical protein
MKGITLKKTMFFFYFHTLLADSKPNFKHIVLFCSDELTRLPFIIRKVQISSY